MKADDVTGTLWGYRPRPAPGANPDFEYEEIPDEPGEERKNPVRGPYDADEEEEPDQVRVTTEIALPNLVETQFLSYKAGAVEESVRQGKLSTSPGSPPPAYYATLGRSCRCSEPQSSANVR